MWSALAQIIYWSLFLLRNSFLINIFQNFKLLYIYHEYKNEKQPKQQKKNNPKKTT